MDDLRNRDEKNTKEVKYLKDRLKLFEGTSASGFKGFSGASALNNNITIASPNLN